MILDTLALKVTRATRVVKLIPAPLKPFLKFFRIHKLIDLCLNKYTDELNFQAEWAKEFKRGRGKVLEYWKKYRRLEDIEKICQIKNTTRVLDVGCGISTVLHYIPGEKYGIDPLADEYKRLYDFPHDMEISRAGGENIPFPDKYFGVVFCSNVLDHVTNPKRTTAEIHRTLNNNGFFILTIELFKKNIKRNQAHPHSLTKKDVRDLISDKFEIVFEKESPWIGMRNYVNNKKGTENNELIIIAQKIA